MQSERVKEKYLELFRDWREAIDNKGIGPLVRTQCRRTAFQVPNDSTVRLSLDTELKMFAEDPAGGPTCFESDRYASLA